MRFTMGSKAYADTIATEDSVQVQRLRSQGAIIMGKTNTPEFGYKGFTENLSSGTGNPWNPSLTPGGSSGGSASAVAAGMVPLCTASDGGGSIRIPSAFSGCFGFKPSSGRIPRADEHAPAGARTARSGPVAPHRARCRPLPRLRRGPAPQRSRLPRWAGRRVRSAALTTAPEAAAHRLERRPGLRRRRTRSAARLAEARRKSWRPRSAWSWWKQQSRLQPTRCGPGTSLRPPATSCIIDRMTRNRSAGLDPASSPSPNRPVH